jgi:glycosyltransferase involved in cell wall biosynthesis
MSARVADGIICIGGEDWWYHNRGHYDFQIMRRLAERVPVLFVNSVGVRMPSPAEGHEFLRRIGRKLQSLSRGLVHIENGFWVMSPLSLPGRAGRALTNPLLGPQIRLAARHIGVRSPLVWVHCPPGADLIEQLRPAAVAFQRTDRFEAFPDGDQAELGRQVDLARSRADLVVYCARSLMAEETALCRAQALADHGVDYDTFLAAGRGSDAGPADIATLPRPRAVFVGGIDHHTFDPDLFLEVAGRLPHVTFALIGGCSLPEGWCRLPNVHLLGRKPYGEVASYMAAADVLLMPWNRGDWIKACNPVKLKEYLATGRPVVSTPYPELQPYREHVRVADTAEAFADAIAGAIAAPGDAEVRRVFVAGHSWEGKAELIVRELARVGVELAPAAERAGRLEPQPA